MYGDISPKSIDGDITRKPIDGYKSTTPESPTMATTSESLPRAPPITREPIDGGITL